MGPLLYEKGRPANIDLWQTGWQWQVKLSRDNTAKALQPETWTKPGQYWGTVTPVVLHHYPDKRKPDDLERILLESFLSAGLPEVDELRIRSASVFQGAGHAASMPRFDPRKSNLTCYQTHLMVRFVQPVTGPVLVGRGRFRGYGLMRPVDQREWTLWN